MAIRILSKVLGNVIDNPPSISQIGRSLLGSDKRTPTGEPQRNYQWEVTFSNSNNDKTAKNARFYAKTVSIPQKSIDIIQSDFMGAKVFHPGKDASAKTVSITFWDDENLTVMEYLTDWFNLVNHETHVDAVSSRKNYSREIIITLYDSTDLRTTAVVTLDMAFPTEISDTSLSYDNSGPIEFSATFTFAKQYIASRKRT